MKSRRAVLAGLGTVGAVGLTGCSALPFGDDGNDREDVTLPADAVEPVSWPESPFPVAVPGALADTHRERAQELLAEVPADPNVPNGAVAEELRSDRERAADRLGDAAEDPWPIERLSAWRSRREAAATVRGAYRAATGEGDAEAVTERRRTVRERLGSFVAASEYRASSPLEAALVYAAVEELVTDCRRYLRPDRPYPSDPVARPFEAGQALGQVERARATLGDARRLEDAYLAERSDASSQWSALIDASGRLRFAVARTRSTVDGFLDVGEPPFEANLDGTAARTLFVETSRQVSSTVQSHEEYRDDGDYARAVIEAGQAVAAVEALRTAIDGIRDGAYQGEVTVDSVTEAAARAREAIAAVEASEHRRLATHFLRPALQTFEYLPRHIEEGYADAPRVQGDLARVELYARAVPAATAFVAQRLE
ncbi:hypothetical protein HZS55_01550 [Halosimplex rubrum]|uniref:Uncharacterized protein n=1 Tax=Halosimplex rubrum TaxID=869889 RepID=A0A7D5SY65_9EURY|nr:hypothetical protein [Halosimplex rubrum]QLH76068.1 hypothetical protein HZS55_01550 [Halosimplex rubrum]